MTFAPSGVGSSIRRHRSAPVWLLALLAVFLGAGSLQAHPRVRSGRPTRPSSPKEIPHDVARQAGRVRNHRRDARP